MPEPRPQYLVSGDRATLILDSASSAALQANGVKLTTLSLETFTQLITDLVPEVMKGIGDDGLFDPALMPPYLTQAAINELNLLDPNTDTVEEQFIPSRLSQSAINAMVNAQNSTIVETDPDGYPVVVGGSDTTTDLNVSGNMSVGNLTAATGHADVFTANQATMGYTESAAFALDNQSVEPGSPAAGKLKLYSDINGRAIYKDQDAQLFRASSKRIVTAWPTAGNSQLGDEAIISATGEHRIYLGATKGWRLASPFQVSSLTDRDAVTNKYPGMRIFVAVGNEQDHVYGTDNKWHGTKSFRIPGATFATYDNVQDSGWRVIGNTSISDPGFQYHVTSQVNMHIQAFRPATLGYLFVYAANPDGTNYDAFSQNFFPLSVNQAGGFMPFTGVIGMTKTPKSGPQNIVVMWATQAPQESGLNPLVHSSHAYDIVPA